MLVLTVGSIPALAGEQPLLAASRKGDAAAVRELLRQRADPNAAEADGTTALHWAVRADAFDAARLLIAAGARVDSPNRYGVTPLSLAAANGSDAMIDALITAGADANAPAAEGETPLMIAARTGRTGAVKVLLAHGARVNTAERWRGQTALLWAAADNQGAVVRQLLESGAGMALRSKGGYTAVLFAARNGATEGLDALLAGGASLADTMPDGTTALMAAIVNGHFRTAMWMLDHGADPNAPDPRGTPLHVLAFLRKPGYPATTGCCVLLPNGHPDTFELAKSLLAHGASPNARIAWKEIPFDSDAGVVRTPADLRLGRNYISFVGATPFYVAAKFSDVPFMRLLLAGGADPLITTVQQVTPLMVAAGLGFWDAESPAPQNGTPESDTLEAVRMILDLGADVNAVADFGDVAIVGDGFQLRRRHPFNLKQLPPHALGDMRWSGSTALHGAALRGTNSVVNLLVERGAKLGARNKLGWTPYALADGLLVANAERRWPETAALLRRLMEQRGVWTAADDTPRPSSGEDK